MLSQRQQRVLKATKKALKNAPKQSTKNPCTFIIKDQNFTQTEFPNDERFRFFGYKAVKVEDYFPPPPFEDYDDDYFIRPDTNSEKFDLFYIYESDEKLLREIATRDTNSEKFDLFSIYESDEKLLREIATRDSDSDSDSECDRFEDIAEEHSARLFSSKNTHKCKNTSRHAKI